MAGIYNMNALDATELYVHLKMVTMVNFGLCAVYHNLAGRAKGREVHTSFIKTEKPVRPCPEEHKS